MLIGAALANALAFTGSSYLFHKLSADNIDAERKRYDSTIEALQAAQIEWTHKYQQRIGVVIALGVISGFGYYIYRSKKVEQPQQNNLKPHPQTQPQTNKFEMDYIFSIL